MIPEGLTCAACHRPFHGHPARRTDAGWVHTWAERICHRLEDIAFMADHDETATGAATRLGIATDSLWSWLADHHARDLWDRLADRDPAMERGRWSSARRAA